jgi:hypothetical protein
MDASLFNRLGWTRDRTEPSLSEVHRSIAVRSGPAWRRAIAFVGALPRAWHPRRHRDAVAVASFVAIVIAGLNVKLLSDFVSGGF